MRSSSKPRRSCRNAFFLTLSEVPLLTCQDAHELCSFVRPRERIRQESPSRQDWRPSARDLIELRSTQCGIGAGRLVFEWHASCFHRVLQPVRLEKSPSSQAFEDTRHDRIRLAQRRRGRRSTSQTTLVSEGRFDGCHGVWNDTGIRHVWLADRAIYLSLPG